MATERNAHGDVPGAQDDPPPLFKSWSTWYTLVFLNLVLLIVLFSIFTRMFR